MMIGLTGGPGSGKSTFAAAFIEAGARGIDADVLGQTLLEESEVVRDALRSAFGEKIFLDSGGAVDRPALASIVFKDPAELTKLNRIVHPHLIRLVHLQMGRLLSDKQCACILDMALLCELSFQPYCDMIVFINAPMENRIHWLESTRGWSREAVLLRIQSQMDDSEKALQADLIVCNDGSKSRLRQEAMRFYRRLCPESG